MAAVIWAQWRSMRNYLPRSRGNSVVNALVGFAWYGSWVLGAFALGLVCAESKPEMLLSFLPPGFLLATLYWQFIPVLMASTGMSLDLRRLVVYPIPHSQLFTLESVLRITAAIEMVVMVLGAVIGLLMNRAVPIWGGPSLVFFIAFNLLLSAGLRDLLGRLMARKRIRELLVFVMVMMAALPQLFLQSGTPKHVAPFLSLGTAWFLPWVASTRLAIGVNPALPFVIMIGWAGLAYAFGKWQFERNLKFDPAESQATSEESPSRLDSLTQTFFRLPSRLFPDPLGAMVEKEFRSLSRTPRFRMVFVMGFSFTLLVWLPLVFRENKEATFLSGHYLTVVCSYALLLISEVCIWNIFGFDRSAAQAYFALPVSISQVLRAKNLAALLFILLDVCCVLLTCMLLRFPITAGSVAEAFGVVITVTVYLISVGNVISLRYPKPVDPEQTWKRTAAGSVQSFLMLVYLLGSIPILLAFGARYAFESEWAFYGMLLIDMLVGLVIYWVALDSAIETTKQKREQILGILSRGEGLLS
jgi:ABC-2 type transport system permease protein